MGLFIILHNKTTPGNLPHIAKIKLLFQKGNHIFSLHVNQYVVTTIESDKTNKTGCKDPLKRHW